VYRDSDVIDIYVSAQERERMKSLFGVDVTPEIYYDSHGTARQIVCFAYGVWNI